MKELNRNREAKFVSLDPVVNTTPFFLLRPHANEKFTPSRSLSKATKKGYASWKQKMLAM